jgi:sterol desaturase/sphingolipid hydroxylase (fatty acid hydroxylase superfamily)
VNEAFEQQRKPRWGEPFRLPGAKFDTCRMFANDFLEKFSRIHPATPFVVYVPLLLYMLYRCRALHGLGVGVIAGMFLTGVLTWTFAEYVLHRWVFHWVNDTAWGKRVHFLLHGVHHDFPSDKDRLVMPLLTSVPFAIIFYALFHFAFGAQLGDAVYAGFALGYLCYDGTHYAVHHFKQTSRVGRFLKRHHMLHHHADHDGGFGVSSPLWDLVFRTMPSVKKLKKPTAASSR